ncbi:MAG: hypothetical protein RLO18_27595, partial [Gimesia chilikensis]
LSDDVNINRFHRLAHSFTDTLILRLSAINSTLAVHISNGDHGLIFWQPFHHPGIDRLRSSRSLGHALFGLGIGSPRSHSRNKSLLVAYLPSFHPGGKPHICHRPVP